MTITAEEIKKAIAEGFIEQKPTHRCGLCKDDPEAAKEMKHIMGFIKDIGDGDIARGVERIRSNTNWTLAVREAAKMSRITIIKTISKGVIIVIGAGLVLLFGEKVTALWGK